MRVQNAYLSEHSEQLYGHCGWWRLTGCESKLKETLESSTKEPSIDIDIKFALYGVKEWAPPLDWKSVWGKKELRTKQV